MERSELINKVKTRIDEVCMSGDTIVDVGIENSKPYDTIIGELLDESALEVLLKAPFFRLNVTNGDVTANGGVIILPADFLRLVSLKMSDWEQSVIELAIQGDEVAKRQANKYLRGGKAKPVGVLGKTEAGYTIKYYTSSTHTVEEFLYIKRDTAENISDTQLIDAMVWICAGKALGVLGEPNLSNLCYENAKGLMV